MNDLRWNDAGRFGGGYSGSAQTTYSSGGVTPSATPQTVLTIPKQEYGPSIFLLRYMSTVASPPDGAAPADLPPAFLRFQVTQDIGNLTHTTDCGPFLPQVIFAESASIAVATMDGLYASLFVNVTATRLDALPAGAILGVFPLELPLAPPMINQLPRRWLESLPLAPCTKLQVLPWGNTGTMWAGLYHWYMRYDGGTAGPFMDPVWGGLLTPIDGAPLASYQQNALAVPDPATASLTVPFHRAFQYGVTFTGPALPAGSTVLVLALS